MEVPGLAAVELVDTPGIDEIAAHARQRLAARVALGADLVLLVLDGDLTTPEAEALEVLLAEGKPVLVVLNRCDCWPEAELDGLLASIRRRLPAAAKHLELLAVASAPRRAVLLKVLFILYCKPMLSIFQYGIGLMKKPSNSRQFSLLCNP